MRLRQRPGVTTHPKLSRSAMLLHRVLFLVLVGSAASWAEPQRARQTPFSMGMRFLGNIRDGMTRTFQGIFGGGPTRSNEANGDRPARQPHLQSVGEVPNSPSGIPFRAAPPAGSSFRAAPPTASPFNVAPPKEAPPTVNPFNAAPLQGVPPTSPPPSSFFTVVHQSDVSTAIPDTPGFTDESFQPNAFLRDAKPFQGTVDEDQLPFYPPHTGGFSDPQPFAHNQLASPHHSFPPGIPSSSELLSFGTISPEDTLRDNAIPSGNTATFNLGNAFKRNSPAADLPSGSQSVPQDSQEGREILGPAPQQVSATQSSDYIPDAHASPHQETPLHAVSHVPSPESVSTYHPTIILKSHSDAPTHVPTQYFTESQHASTSQESQATTPEHRVTTQYEITADLSPVAREAPQLAKEQHQQPSKKPVVSLKVGAGHINAGTRMSVSPKENADGSQGVEVSGYEFGYGVLDADTGNQFFHAEKREEGQTKGSYKIQLPDGRVQTVTYVANSNGFQPKITYDGDAQYPGGPTATEA